jgi:hypothetical protein
MLSLVWKVLGDKQKPDKLLKTVLILHVLE